MPQAQLRAFIPEMLKYSTGRGKPGWGKESCKPIWWPEDIPWANVRSDVRTEEQKQRVRLDRLLPSMSGGLFLGLAHGEVYKFWGLVEWHSSGKKKSHLKRHDENFVLPHV